MQGTIRYLLRNRSLVLGIGLLLALVVFIVGGHFVVDVDHARALSVRPLQPPVTKKPVLISKKAALAAFFLLDRIPS